GADRAVDHARPEVLGLLRRQLRIIDAGTDAPGMVAHAAVMRHQIQAGMLLVDLGVAEQPIRKTDNARRCNGIDIAVRAYRQRGTCWKETLSGPAIDVHVADAHLRSPVFRKRTLP